MIISILLIIAIVAFDQITKILATEFLMPIGSIGFIPGIMDLKYVLNDGAAFSMMSGSRWLLVGITTVSLIAVIYIVLFKKDKLKKYEYLSLVLIIGGGIGNLIDRVLYGHVVDFFDTTFIDFAVFNVADCFVCIGLALLIITVVFDEYKLFKDKKRSNNANK